MSGRTVRVALLELLLLLAWQLRVADAVLLPGVGWRSLSAHSLSAHDLFAELSLGIERTEELLHSHLYSGLPSPNASAASLVASGDDSEQSGGITCGVQFRKHPDSVTCPSACPYIRMEIGGICDMSCVTAANCAAKNPIMNFANPQTMQCQLCKVPACDQCGGSNTTCAKCEDGYTLISGECYGKDRWYWRAVYVVLAVAVITVVTYVITTLLRPVEPEAEAVLAHAKKFRDMSKRRDPRTGRKYPLTIDIRNTLISGVGAMLHFKFQYWACAFSLFIFTLLWAVSLYVGPRPEVMKTSPVDEASFDICNYNVKNMIEDVSEMESIYFWAVVFIYLLTTAASIAFAVHQRRFASKTSEMETTMQDFCLTVRHLRKRPGTKPVEEDLKREFEELLKDAGKDSSGIKLVGVSVCWDYRKCVEQLENQVKLELEETEQKWEEINGKLDTARKGVELRKERRHSDEGPEASQGTVLRQRSNIKELSLKSDLLRRLQFLKSVDQVFLMGDEEDDDVLSPDDMGVKEIRAMLENLVSSGKAFLVFHTEKDRDLAMEHLRALAPEVMKDLSNGKDLKFKAEDTEPETVMWQNSGTKSQQLFMNMVIGIIGMVLGVALLDIFFYFPSIAYFLSVSDVAGMSHGGVQGTLLGMLVCICNQCIYFMIGAVADMCGFANSDTHQQFYVVGYTAAVFINTIIDLFVVMLLAQGYSMDQAINMQTEGHGAMSTRAISESPSMQKAVYDQYWAYIFPSCLLIPFLMEPIAGEFIYILKTKIVGSHPEVTVQEAELQLQCPPFDLARYGDILVNLMLCMGVLAFTYRDIHQLFGCLFLSLGWLYILDTFRFLRTTMKGKFVSSKLDVTAQWLCSVPCGILAGCIAFRLCGSSRKEDLMKDLPKEVRMGVDLAGSALHRDTIVVVIFMAIIAHILIHCAILKYYVPGWSEVHEDHDQERTYADEAEHLACNWFTANPVYCLRSKYYYNHSPPCIKWAPGKEFLLEPNPSIGLHYDPATHKVEEIDTTYDTASTFREIATSVKESADPHMQSLQQSIRRLASGSANQPPSSGTDQQEGKESEKQGP